MPFGPIEEIDGNPVLLGSMKISEVDHERFPGGIDHVGRSGQAQLGVDLQADDIQNTVFRDGEAEVPVRIVAHGELREEVMDHVLKLSQTTKLRVGRLISKETPMQYEATKAAFDNGEIACVGEEGKDYRINQDGSVSLRLHPGGFVLDTDAIKRDPELLSTALVHGRDGIMSIQDFDPKAPRLIKPQELFVGGIGLSTGNHSALIRPEVSDQIYHLKGGRKFDAYRSSRINPRYGASGLRQVELFNRSSQSVDRSGIWVTVDLYPKTDPDKPISRHFETREDKAFMHEHGPSFIQATSLDEPGKLDLLFDAITSTISKDDLYARVITRNGVTPVPWSERPKFQKNASKEAVLNTEGHRSQEEQFADFIEGLGETKDQGRVFICHNLPSADQLNLLCEAGVRAFIFKGIKSRPEDFEEGAEPLKNNLYLDGHLYQTIKKLERQGVSFVFALDQAEEDGTQSVQLREFYKGFWLKPESKQRFDKIEMVIDMYGWHKDALAEMDRDSIREFFRNLIDSVGKEKIAIAHGKGPGYMQLADELARELGIFSIGIGIDVEKIDQKPNIQPEAMLDFVGSERLSRQNVLVQVGGAAILNIGGNGTKEETGINESTVKLLEKFPYPQIFVDSSEGDHLWLHNYLQTKELCTKTAISHNKNGEVRDFDISQTPLTLPWLYKTMHLVEDYEEAFAVYQNFLDNPIAYWKEAGVIPAEDKVEPGDRYDAILLAYERERNLSQETERALPEFILKAMSKVEAHKAALIAKAKIQ